jgi:hypothetical protein
LFENAVQTQRLDGALDPVHVEPRQLGLFLNGDLESDHAEVEEGAGLEETLQLHAAGAQIFEGRGEVVGRRQRLVAGLEVLEDLRHLAPVRSDHDARSGERHVQRHLGLRWHEREQRRPTHLGHLLDELPPTLHLDRVQQELDDLAPGGCRVPEVELRDDADVRHRIAVPRAQVQRGHRQAKAVHTQLEQLVGVEGQPARLVRLPRMLDPRLEPRLTHLQPVGEEILHLRQVLPAEELRCFPGVMALGQGADPDE